MTEPLAPHLRQQSFFQVFGQQRRIPAVRLLHRFADDPELMRVDHHDPSHSPAHGPAEPSRVAGRFHRQFIFGPQAADELGHLFQAPAPQAGWPFFSGANQKTVGMQIDSQMPSRTGFPYGKIFLSCTFFHRGSSFWFGSETAFADSATLPFKVHRPYTGATVTGLTKLLYEVPSQGLSPSLSPVTCFTLPPSESVLLSVKNIMPTAVRNSSRKHSGGSDWLQGRP